MQTWNHHCWIDKKVPPEEFFGREIGTALEFDTFDEIIVFGDTFNSAPEVPSFKVILRTESFDAGLQICSLFDRKGLSNSVDKLKFGIEIDDVHSWIFVKRLL